MNVALRKDHLSAHTQLTRWPANQASGKCSMDSSQSKSYSAVAHKLLSSCTIYELQSDVRAKKQTPHYQ